MLENRGDKGLKDDHVGDLPLSVLDNMINKVSFNFDQLWLAIIFTIKKKLIYHRKLYKFR